MTGTTTKTTRTGTRTRRETAVTDWRDSFLHEKESAWLYRRVVEAEPDPVKKQLFEKLADAAEGQASKWVASHGGETPDFRPSPRARIVATLTRGLGPRRVRPVLAAMKLRGLSVYTAPAAPGHAMPTSVSQVGERHRGVSGGNFRASVFGVNDGLVSNASLVMGVAGSGAGSDFVTLAGISGLLAGALSMAAGEYVSVRSQRDMFDHQIALEREELAEYPEEEAEELALIYNARGISLENARAMSRELIARPERALDALAREELGLNPDDLGSPWGAASSSFLAFAFGAVLPLLPFLLGLTGMRAIVVTAVLSVVALAAIGMMISLFTGREAWRGALRMVLIGGGAGLVAYLVGGAIGTIV